MNILRKLFHRDTESVQATFNEDSEGVGGEIDVSSTKETTKKE